MEGAVACFEWRSYDAKENSFWIHHRLLYGVYGNTRLYERQEFR